MATNWLTKLFSGGSQPQSAGGAIGMPGGSAKYTPSAQRVTSNNASSERLSALATYYKTKYNPVTGKYGTIGGTTWRRPTSEELAGIPQRTGYANFANRTQQEYLTGQSLRNLNGFMQGTGMSQEEWIRRQRAAPVGYTYTPYAGWVPTPNGPALNNQPTNDYYAGGGYGGGGGGSGYAPAAATVPDWYQSFLNQVNWRI